MLFLAGWLVGQDRGTTQKITIHAVAWTPLEDATEQDIENFKEATASI